MLNRDVQPLGDRASACRRDSKDGPVGPRFSRGGFHAPELVVAGDRNDARSLDDVNRVTVAVQRPAATTSTVTGALTIEEGSHTQVLTATELASLPQHTLDVTFEAGTATQQDVEVGPTLQAVLRAAHIRTDLKTWVAAVGSDGYVATVTPAEAWVGGRPLLISLSEDGTSHDLVVGQSQLPGWPWWGDR